jgi:adenylate cyclase
MAWSCTACSGENPEAMRFCGHCGAERTHAPKAASTVTVPDVAAEAEADVAHALRSFVAEPVADRLMAGGGELPQERRLITALFADVSGFTSLADRLDPEELLEVIDPVISGLSSIVGRYEGYVEKFAGDALLALFGAPVSHEDDAERALLVALEMHRELARLSAELPHDADLTLHCGVNSGHGIARILGSDARMDYAVLGDSVILAQRLESAAPTGETYVSELTYRLTAERFEFESVGDLTLKGKSKPVPVWRLLGERAMRAAKASGTATVLVGRERELERLGTVLDRVSEGRGAVAAVTGEPGVGKTRLTEALRARAAGLGARWLETRCLSYGSGLPYWPYAELVRGFAAVPLDDVGDDARRRLEQALASSGTESALPFFARLLALPGGTDDIEALEPEAFRRGLHDAIAAWIRALTRDGPVVLAIEDLHWADASSIELTREVADACHDAPLLVYLVARSEAASSLAAIGGDEPLHHVELAELDDNAVTQLVGGLLGGKPPPGLSEYVRERTAGNPLFVEELIRSLRETGALNRDDGAWRLRRHWDAESVPPTIEELLASRIDLLPRDAAALLQTGSVIGRRIRIPLLEAIAETSVEGTVSLLVENGFFDALQVDGEALVVFHHALVQDVAYSRLLRKQRRDLHQRVADVAEELYGAGDDVIDLLARHLYLGTGGAKAVDYLVRAGERARRLFANDEAILHLRHAVELTSSEPSLESRRLALLSDLADLHDLVGDYDEALRLYVEVRDATNELHAWRGIISTHRKRGEYADALAAADAAFRTDSLAGVDLTSLWIEQGTTLSVAGHFGQAIDVLEAGLAAAGGRRDGVIGQLLVPLARAEMLAGKPEDALRHASEAEALFDANHDLRSLSSTARLLGDIYRTLGRPDEAVARLRRGLELAERVGNVEEIGGCLINLGLAERARGAVDEAIACYHRAIEEFERIRHGSGRAIAYSNLAWALANKGDYEAAERYCRTAIDLARAIDNPLVGAETTDTLAFISLRRGSTEEAAARAEEAAQLFLELGAPPKAAQSLELAAEAWEGSGDPERARAARARARSLG